MSIRFLHTSDFQIGMTRWFLEGEAQARFDGDRVEAIRRLGKVAKEHDCDFIIAAGDIFDGNALSEQTFSRAAEELYRVAKDTPIYLLAGNHDPLDAHSYFPHLAENSANIYILEAGKPLEATAASGEKVEIIGAPLYAKEATRDLVAEALAPLEPVDYVRIAVGHGQPPGYQGHDDLDAIDLDNVNNKIAAGVIDYLGLGDTHSTKQLDKAGRVWFSGSPETTDFHKIDTDGGENNSGNVLVVSVDKQHIEVETIPVGVWFFEQLRAEINSLGDAQEFIARLEAYPEKKNTVIKYALVGVADSQTKAYLEAELAALEPVFAALMKHDRLMNLVVKPDLDALGLSGFVYTSFQELVERSQQLPRKEKDDVEEESTEDEEIAELNPQDLDQAQTIDDALNLFYRYAMSDKNKRN
ncbi:DNA repair exonuclease [Corynebacterium sp. sy017]|uniref:metallophosphoesterase family protein n=1 Tax=unclassified Corynebacterium TaxID=2624378 RepID=UPI0011869B3D|nr:MULTISPECIES: metallophosphoesterase [unclassified Corynebacterium]MBP3088992.1 DNA repair exonuclease [Corynebacterium sp. sy017]TSD91314.1 DNA repair exonuclease [Corynebacterium sp. SY003]